jgi:hypothetical protein
METIMLDEFSSDRVFSLTDYLIGHQHLLSRSRAGVGGEQNVDLIFAAVQYVELPTLLNGILVFKPRDAQSVSLEQRAGVDTRGGDRIFVIESQGRRFCIVASAHWIHVNTLNDSSLVPMCGHGADIESYYANHVKESYRIR